MKITTTTLTLEQVKRVVFKNEQVELDPAVLDRVQASFDFLKRFSDEKTIYGINTGFGPMARYRVDDASRAALQYNLIRGHCTGAGRPVPPLHVRAILLARLNTFLQGYSGIHPGVVTLLAGFLNHDITPLVPEHGSVGASGDLVQLAHVALCLVGEGEVFYRGERRPTREVMDEIGLEPVRVHVREGLALANGTSAMTGIGLVNVIRARQLLELSIRSSCLVNEITASFDDHFSEELNRAKAHPGQSIVAGKMRDVLAGSRRTRKREEYYYRHDAGEKVQEHYSLRCVPQVLGPVLEAIEGAATVLEREINSASDNPVVDRESGNVYHGGNFHGDYVSLEMDRLKIALTRLTMLAERQMNYLFHDRVNGILPPFVNLGVKGLNHGLQAAQFTATSTTAESQTLAFPMYLHSIPNNNDNQDIVSMGTNAAQITATVVENAFQVMSIHFMAIAQAIDCLEIHDALSPAGKEIYDETRERFPLLVEDRPLHGDIERVNHFLQAKEWTR
ncbi:MAG: aromatic amino acid ammonia-lyase [Odoribacteraceae bacterium]|jgi:histidine ammonia-lyase|nr:aromatic amino acid ammonia-lyase [Odoribacteraceae bacterium]